MDSRALAAVLLLCPAVSAQEPRLSTTVRLVVAPATVIDAHGNYVSGLSEADFVVLDSGRQRPAEVEVTYVPISLVVAIQTSDLSETVLNKVRRIGGMIEPLLVGARGEVAVLAFDRDVRTLVPFTSDAEAVRNAFRGLAVSGTGSALCDAVAEASRLLAGRPVSRRRVLLVVSEAKDRSSKTSLEDAVSLAQRENVIVYNATFSAFRAPFAAKGGEYRGGPFNLLAIFTELRQVARTNAASALAHFTGGLQLPFTRQRALESALTKVGEDLHSQYWLSFTVPGDPDGQFHPIQVAIRGRPDLTVRTRPGYWNSAVGEAASGR